MFFEIDKTAFNNLPVVLNSIGKNIKQDKISRPDGLPFHEIIWVSRGVGTFSVAEKSFVISEGQGVFMRSGVEHEYYGDDFDTAWCTFSMPEKTLDYIGIPQVMRFDVPGFLESELETLYDFAVGESTIATRSAAVYSYLTDFFTAILENDDRLSQKVQKILESKYGEPLTLEIIASEIGIDHFTLCHSFTKETGTTIMQELKRIRIAKAKRLLKYSSESIENIGKMCGFESPSYFGKRFREICGCSPSEYRKG